MNRNRPGMSAACRFVIAAIVGLPLAALAATTPSSNAGSAAFPFLRQEVGARASALAGASSAAITDASAIWSNPAALVRLAHPEYLLSYQNQFGEFNAGYLAVAFPRTTHAFGASLQFYSYGTFTQTDQSGNVTGSFSGGDLVGTVAYARQFGRMFSAGIAGKFITESIQNFSASGLALDLGLRYESDRGRSAAAVVLQNLGTQLDALGTEKSKLPLQLRLGGMIRPRAANLQLSAEGILPADNRAWGALGVEYTGIRSMALRLGWNSYGSNAKVEQASADLAGFSAGVGFEIAKKVTLGYSIGSHGDLGENHRVTISGGF